LRTLHFALATALLLLAGCDTAKTNPAPTPPDTPISSAVPTTRIATRRAPASRSHSQPDFENRQRPTVSTDTPTTGPAVQVSGYVVYKGGAPATSATIELWSSTGDYGKLLPESTRLGSTRVAKNGNYSLRGPDGENLRLLVKNAPFAIAEIPGTKPDTTATVTRKVTQNFTLPISVELQGKVLTEDDQPIPGALVSLQSDDIEDDGWFYGNQQTTTTAAGVFAIPHVATGPATIGAVTEGIPPATQKINLPTSGPLIIRLTTGTATINGTAVHYPAESPVSGGTVKLHPSTKAEVLGLGSSTSAPIGPDGAFQLTQLPAGPASLGVLSASGQNLWPAPVPSNGANLTLSSCETTSTRLVVFEGYTIAGTVFDKDTSEPLSGATVKMSKDSKAVTQSDENGQYSFKALRPAVTYSMDATLPGYGLDPESTVGYPGKLEAKVTTASTHLLRDIPMVRLVTVSGRVENEEAFPIPNATVHWRRIQGLSIESITDGEGRFSLLTSPFSRGIFETTAEGYAFHRTTETVTVAMDDVKDILITMKRAAIVEGRVVNRAGQGVPSAFIRTGNESVQIGESVSMSSRLLASTDSSGLFRIDNLENGKQMLHASAKNYGYAIKALDVKAGENISGVEIELPDPPEGVVAGRVIDENEKGVIANLAIIQCSPATPYAKSDSDGNFEIKNIPGQGKVELMVFAQDPPRTKRVMAQIGDRNLVIEFDEQAVLLGRVEDAITGEAIPEFELSGFGSWDRKVMNPGEFTGRMRPNTFNNLTISANGYPKQTFKVKAPAETGEFRQTFKMQLGGTLRGTVVFNETQKPAADVAVAAYSTLQSQNEPVGSTITGEDGSFLISRVPPGKIKVTAHAAPPLAPAHKLVDVKDGELTDAGELAIGASSSITGRLVRLPTKQPVPELDVVLNGP